MQLLSLLCLTLVVARAPATFLATQGVRGVKKQPVNVLAKGDTSCYKEKDNGKSYRGLATSTASGRTCQRWVEDHPHGAAAEITPTPDNGLGNHNYCRNPDGSMDKPWCFTMDTNPDKAKEACAIPVCERNGVFARNFHKEAEYLKLNVSATDCQCAAQLYGATTTTADTSVSLAEKGAQVGKDHLGRPC